MVPLFLFMVPLFSHMLPLNLLMVPLILLNWCLYLCIWCLCCLKKCCRCFRKWCFKYSAVWERLSGDLAEENCGSVSNGGLLSLSSRPCYRRNCKHLQQFIPWALGRFRSPTYITENWSSGCCHQLLGFGCTFARGSVPWHISCKTYIIENLSSASVHTLRINRSRPGRPSYEISADQLQSLIDLWFTVPQIARLLCVSTRTIEPKGFLC